MRTFCASNRQFRLWPNLLVAFFLIIVANSAARAQDVVIDWAKKQIQSAPAEINSPRRITIAVVNVNDMLYTYTVSVTAVPRQISDSDAIGALLNSLASGPAVSGRGGILDCTKWQDLEKAVAALQAKFNAILNAPKAGKTADGKDCIGYCSITLAETTTKWNSDISPQLPGIISLINTVPPGCLEGSQITALKDFQDQITTFDKQLSGTNHQVSIVTTFAPDNDYRIDVSEFYNGQTTDNGVRQLTISPSSSILTLSLGPVFSEIQNRSYGIRTVPAPTAANPNNTNNVISVDGASSFTPYVAALLNYRIPLNKWIFDEHPLTVTSGPVVRVSSGQGASAIGYFAGVSVTLFNRLFLTPGVQVGQFADFPQGFTAAGQSVPPGITTLTPTNRNTVRFAFGISYKTHDFSKVGGQPQLQAIGQNNAPVSASGAAPTISKLSVSSGSARTSVTITGTNFGATQGTSTVTFNGTPATPTSWSATTVVVPVPAGATTGNVVVTVGGQASAGVPFTVSSGAPAGSAKNTSADWTVMVFMNAKNNLEKDAFLNFSQMANVGSTDRINVLVEFGRPKVHYYSADESPWSGVKIFRVTKGMLPNPQNAVLDVGEADMGAGKTLASFVSWSGKYYPADHYMLVIWDHGQGWRLQLADDARIRTMAANQEVRLLSGGRPSAPPNAPSSTILGGIKSVSYDQDTGNILYNRDIQDSLARALKEAPFNGAKVDVIGFDACLMAMMETAYAMRNVGQVLVGSEEEEPGEGWNYQKWLEKVQADSKAGRADRKTVANDAVSAFEEVYGGAPTGTTLSSLDLAAIEPLATSLGVFANTAKSMLPAQFSTFSKARNAISSYGAHARTKTSVDLSQFLDQLSKAFPNSALSISATQLRKAISGLVLQPFASPDMKKGYGSFGLAIYFPASAADFKADPDSSGYDRNNDFFAVQFVKDIDWSLLVSAYVNADSSRSSKR
jgi:hypothetical protein